MATDRDEFGKKRNFDEMLNVQLPKSFGSSSCSFSHKKSRNDPSLEPLVDSLFNKQFTINNTNFKIPESKTIFTETPWVVPELQEIKAELNSIKNKLNDYNITEWHQHTSRRNKAGDVQWRIKKEIDPEFLTQAWSKFYENASVFPLVPKIAIQAKKLMSVHLCEAPGAFITSLNHWLKLNAPSVEWDWVATTLNPYYEGNPISCMINDDRFIISSLEHWCFGTDYTGNLMSLKNMENLVEIAHKKGEVLLVTADGSIDCTNDPGEQESIVAPLHFCEAVTALKLLSTHGSLLLKMFTIFEHESLCLVYFLSCLFEKVFINKPVTSKEGNSETYLVCLDYRGPDFARTHLDVLTDCYENRSNKSMFCRRDLPEDFVQQMISCGQFFKDCQSKVILKNIESYHCGGNKGHLDNEVKRIKYLVANKFIAEYGLKKLKGENSEVVGRTKLGRIHSINLDPRIPNGSYNERRSMVSLDPSCRLLALCNNMNLVELRATTQWFTFSGTLDAINVNCGKPFSKVESSKFCMGKFLQIRNTVHDILDTLGIDPPGEEVKTIQDYISKVECDTKNYKHLCFKQSSLVDHNKTMNKLSKKLKNVGKGQSLVLIGYSLLTQLNVGVLYLLAHTFKSLGLILNEQFGCIIILKCNLFNESILQFVEEIHKATIEAKVAGESVLAVLPISKLFESDLYASVINANHWSIKHYVNNISKYTQKK